MYKLRLFISAVLLFAASGVMADSSSDADATTKPWKWGLGLGMENRMEKEVNPEFSDLRAIGVLFQQVRRGPWGGILELSSESSDTSSGGLHIQAASVSVQVWGRYNFYDPDHWSPFATLGTGVNFDRVTTGYHDLSDVRRGHRFLGGLGAGLRTVFWQYFLVEGEARGEYIQNREQPDVSLIVRAGVQI